MKKHLLKTLLTALMFLTGEVSYAQTPFLQEKTNFGGTAVSQLSTFVPLGSTYTLELTGCVAGEEISVLGGSFSYTPTMNGSVRFVRNGGAVVYVYEGTAYKGTVNVSDPEDPTYPDIFSEADNAGNKTGIYSDVNLFSNPGFETLGDKLANNQYKAVGWEANGYTYSNRSRVRDNANLAGQEGSCTFLIHGYGNPADNLAQKLTSLSSFTSYQVKFQIWFHEGAACTYTATVGTAIGNGSLYSGEVSTPGSGSATRSFTFTTGAITEENYYFALTRKTASRLGNFDRMTLVAANGGGIGITGATGAKFLADKAYAPEGLLAAVVAEAPIDVTSRIVNPTFDTDLTGWNSPIGGGSEIKVADNRQEETRYFYQTWNGTPRDGRMYQVIENMPQGTYEMELIAFADQAGTMTAASTTVAVYAQGQEVGTPNSSYVCPNYVNNTAFTSYKAYAYVDATGKLEIGMRQYQPAQFRWLGMDNVTLKYISTENVEETKMLELYKDKWTAASTTLGGILSDETYQVVSGKERKDLNDALQATITDDSDYKTVADAANTAYQAFIAAKDAYDFYAGYSDVTLEYADPAKKPAVTEETTAASLITALRAYYESNALAEGVEGAEDKTASLTNYKNPSKTDGWTVSNTTGNSNMRTISDEPYTNSDGSAATGYFDSNSWGSAFATTFTQEVELPQGVYILTAKARGNGTTTYKVIADDESTDITPIGNTGGVFGRGWNDYTVEFEVKATKTVMLGMQMETGSSGNWLSFSDFRLVRIGDSEEGAVLAEANIFAADDDAVAVGKLRDAIAAYNDRGEIAELAAAVEQFKVDNADQEKDETAKVATNGWKKFTGNEAAGVCATNFAPAITTYDGRTAQLAEVFEGNGNTTGQVLYQDITGLTNGTYKVGFYGNAFSTSGRDGFECTMEDGADDVAYVFANDQKAYITAHIATSTTENNFRQFDVEVTNGTIKLGMGKEKDKSTNWHTMQIYQLTWFTTAKAVYALDKTEMTNLISEANVLAANEYKAEGKDALNTAITAAQTALESNKLNISEFEAEIQALRTAIETFTAANYVAMTGTYYVQNAATGKYMAAGHKWGTQAIVNESGLDMTLAAGADKKVTFDSQVFNGDNNHFLGSSLYMDTPAYAWIIEQTGENEYTIGNGAKYLGADASDNLVLVDEAVTWKFLAAADVQSQRLADGLTSLEAATADNGVDATFLLKDANFNRGDHRWAAWTVSDNCTNQNLGGGCTENNGNGCAESYHSLFTISQTVSNAPAGVYKMTAQGFFRQDDSVTEDCPLFFAGDKTAEIPAMAGSEDNMGDASVSFTNGQYTIDPIEFIVGEDGVLTVGIKNETAVHQWVIFDNFQLTYYGPAPKASVTLAVTDAKWATFVAPFDVEVPGGVTAWVVEGVDGETNEVVMGELSTIPANKPVVLFSDAAYSTEVEGVAVAAGEEGLSYGRLVGTYEDIDAPSGSYILQNHSGAVAFYRVDTEVATPKVKAYHAYLDVSGDARAYYFGGEATAIGALKALTSGDAEIYDVNGRKQAKLQKGVNIIRTKDGRTQKVMVK